MVVFVVVKVSDVKLFNMNLNLMIKIIIIIHPFSKHFRVYVGSQRS